MSRRHTRRQHSTAVPVFALLGLVAVGIAIRVLYLVVHLLPLLLVVAAVVAVVYLAGRWRRARPRVGRAPVRLIESRPVADDRQAALEADNARLRAEIEQLRRQATDLRRQVAEAAAARDAAWDAAASVPPRQPRNAPGRDHLLADPLSGARPIGGGR